MTWLTFVNRIFEQNWLFRSNELLFPNEVDYALLAAKKLANKGEYTKLASPSQNFEPIITNFQVEKALLDGIPPEKASTNTYIFAEGINQPYHEALHQRAAAPDDCRHRLVAVVFGGRRQPSCRRHMQGPLLPPTQRMPNGRQCHLLYRWMGLRYRPRRPANQALGGRPGTV